MLLTIKGDLYMNKIDFTSCPLEDSEDALEAKIKENKKQEQKQEK